MSDQNTCYCCDGLSVKTPVEVYNRAGLSNIVYRAGTHPQFKQSLLARLSLSGQLALKNLTTREDNDFTIALLDAWSVIADILTFYQERIANESYLATATERFSILQLSRLIGYELKPGVAATSYIAFTLDDSPGALGPLLPPNNLTGLLQSLPPVTIDKGVKIQSVPGPGEKAQTFETVESIAARAEWNNIKPRLTQPQTPLTKGVLLLKGIQNNLKVGDAILVNDPQKINDPANYKSLQIVNSIVTDKDLNTTRIYFQAATPALPSFKQPEVAKGNLSMILTPRLLTTNVVLNSLVNTRWKESDFNILIKANRWSPKEVYQSINIRPAPPPPPADPIPPPGTPPPNPEAYVFRKRVPVFGYNAPLQTTYNGGTTPIQQEWALSANDKNATVISLDNAYEEILPASHVVVQNPKNTTNPYLFYQAKNVNITTRSDYSISSKTTQLVLTDGLAWQGILPSNPGLDSIRQVTVYTQSEQLQLADLPVEDKVFGNILTLDRYYPGLQEGQAIILSGERDGEDLAGVSSSELVFIKEVNIIAGFTELTFQDNLSFTYIRKTVTINANVAMATHGETVEEILGNGDGSAIFQTFKLKQPPLTFVPAVTETGAKSTLEIRVNNLLWHEVDYFLNHTPDERIYITRQDNDGNTTVTFGDGINGSRVPTGQQNIKARYRKGIGTGALVKANQLSQLQIKPLGVKSAINPVAASGAQDAETLNSARSNASLTILTLGRVVSLQDYEDFARAFAGVEKALATWTLVNGRRHIYITVAGIDGAEVPVHGTLYDAITKAGDSKVAVQIAPYSPRFFQVSAGLVIDADYVQADVFANAEQRLRNTFSFQARKFAQPVTYSEVVACLQQTPGVIAVDINAFFRSDVETTNIPSVIEAAMPVIIPITPATPNGVIGAELLTLDPRPVDLRLA